MTRHSRHVARTEPAGANGRAGDWAEIRFDLLRPEQRPTFLADDTRRVPLQVRVKGFLESDARIADETVVETVLGRRVRGRLVEVSPPPRHSFGAPVAELLAIGLELRQRLRAAGAHGA